MDALALFESILDNMSRFDFSKRVIYAGYNAIKETLPRLPLFGTVSPEIE